MNNEAKNDQAVEMEQTELESIMAALRVRSGLQAGARSIVPCV
jgi:hypothetical protein